VYRIRTRRHHRTAMLAERRNPNLVTARAFLGLLGYGPDFSERYAAQVTRAAKRQGACPAARTWTTRNGRARATAAYDLTAQAMDLLLAVIAYKRTASGFGLAA
jgi:hypothetical protein